MRSIFHEILARYLDSEQHAFDASPRELWPQSQLDTRWQAAARSQGRATGRDVERRAYVELEPQN
jgi:hypothetical protein